MVYEELVVVGKVFYMPDDYAVQNEKPVSRHSDEGSCPYAYNHSVWEEEGDFDSSTFNARLNRVHDEAKSSMTEDLDCYTDDLSDYFRNGERLPLIRLNYLEFDVTNAYCTIGCCRMVNQFWRSLMILGPDKTSFLGVRDAEEEGTIMNSVLEAFYNLPEELPEKFRREFELDDEVDEEEIKKVLGVVFSPRKAHWEQWKVDTK
ncbi:hypothetical protein J4E91_009229 [Alternaria rosae]|nr:hypothetical protein J4E91_009229 [Alternaria rosae]